MNIHNDILIIKNSDNSPKIFEEGDSYYPNFFIKIPENESIYGCYKVRYIREKVERDSMCECLVYGYLGIQSISKPSKIMHISIMDPDLKIDYNDTLNFISFTIKIEGEWSNVGLKRALSSLK